MKWQKKKKKKKIYVRQYPLKSAHFRLKRRAVSRWFQRYQEATATLPRTALRKHILSQEPVGLGKAQGVIAKGLEKLTSRTAAEKAPESFETDGFASVQNDNLRTVGVKKTVVLHFFDGFFVVFRLKKRKKKKKKKKKERKKLTDFDTRK
jgi:hypothetical protein